MAEQVSGYTVGDNGVEVPEVVDRATAVARVQEGLGFRTDREITIIKRLQEAQRDLERGKTLPTFLLVSDATLSVAIGSGLTSLPTDFLRRADVTMYYTSITSGRRVDVPWKVKSAALQAYQLGRPRGPQVAVLENSGIRFFPERDRAYTVTWSYYRFAEPLVTNITNLWLEHAPELLIGEAGLRMARDTRNASAVDIFTNMKAAAMVSWYKETILNEVDDQSFVMGGDN